MYNMLHLKKKNYSNLQAAQNELLLKLAAQAAQAAHMNLTLQPSVLHSLAHQPSVLRSITHQPTVPLPTNPPFYVLLPTLQPSNPPTHRSTFCQAIPLILHY